MPIVMTQIDHVSERSVSGGRKKFDVHPVRPVGYHGWSPIYETFDPWVASLCERAGELHQTVTMGVRDTRYGSEIVTVALNGEGTP